MTNRSCMPCVPQTLTLINIASRRCLSETIPDSEILFAMLQLLSSKLALAICIWTASQSTEHVRCPRSHSMPSCNPLTLPRCTEGMLNILLKCEERKRTDSSLVATDHRQTAARVPADCKSQRDESILWGARRANPQELHSVQQLP